MDPKNALTYKMGSHVFNDIIIKKGKGEMLVEVGQTGEFCRKLMMEGLLVLRGVQRNQVSERADRSE